MTVALGGCGSAVRRALGGAAGRVRALGAAGAAGRLVRAARRAAPRAAGAAALARPRPFPGDLQCHHRL